MTPHLLNTEFSLEEKNEKTYLEWLKFVNGRNDIDTDLVPPYILEGWLRCRKRGLDPFHPPKKNILHHEALEKLLTDHRMLIDIAAPVLEKLFQYAKASTFGVTLFNSNGYLLQVREEDQYADTNHRFLWHPGVQWTEDYAGNNTVSVILETRKPARVIGAQHYIKHFHYVSAFSAPIFYPDGQLAGGIALTTFLHITHPHTYGMAIAAAQAIENALKTRRALTQRNAAIDETDIIQRLQKAIVTFVPDALIAVNNEGRIYAMNERAQNLFGLENDDVTGRYLQDIYPGDENRAFLELIDQQASIACREVRITTPRGVGDYALTCNVITADNNAPIGKVLILSEIKRIRSLVNKFLGAKANFQFSDIRSQNSQFIQAVEEARAVAENASNVLLSGESGTGKDVLAQAIHNASPRRDGPYIAINCAAIPRDLIASELFGYAEGAFTGSRRGGNQGKFELADSGTIFLDEIAEIPFELQAVLLRVIEDKSVVRIGGTKIREVDVRIICATNRNLLTEVNKGNFRKDLYYRLNVCNITLPPLRERIDDIPLLVDTFVQKYAVSLGKTITHVDDKVLDTFFRHPWPGNVRELQNVVERMINYAPSDTLTANLIPMELIDSKDFKSLPMNFEAPEEVEKRMIRHLLNLKYPKKKIADSLKISRTTLFRKMKKYDIVDPYAPS